MTPAEKHLQNAGKTQPLPGILRDALTGDSVPQLASKNPAHKTGHPVPHIRGRGLTKLQKATLSRLAAAAYAAQDKHGLIDPATKLDAWRQSESISAVGVRISQAAQSHYLPLKGHFEALAGKTGVPTLQALVAPTDDPDRQNVSKALRTALAGFAQIPDIHHQPTGPFRAESYLLAVANARAVVKVGSVREILDTWPVAKIWTLVYTLRNRTAAKLDKGDQRARNKSQRKG